MERKAEYMQIYKQMKTTESGEGDQAGYSRGTHRRQGMRGTREQGDQGIKEVIEPAASFL